MYFTCMKLHHNAEPCPVFQPMFWGKKPYWSGTRRRTWPKGKVSFLTRWRSLWSGCKTQRKVMKSRNVNVAPVFSCLHSSLFCVFPERGMSRRLRPFKVVITPCIYPIDMFGSFRSEFKFWQIFRYSEIRMYLNFRITIVPNLNESKITKNEIWIRFEVF